MQEKIIHKLSFISLFLLSTQAFSAQCVGGEGVNTPPEWSVEWNKAGSSKLDTNEKWSSSQTSNGVTLTADLNIKRTKNKLFVKKTNVSDGNDCEYTGDISNDAVKGTYHCNSGGPYNFELNCRWNSTQDDKLKASLVEKNKKKEKILAAEESRKYEHACENYYPGKVGRIKTQTFLATKDGFIVRYINKQRKVVTIEGTTGGNSLQYGEMRELPCGTLLQQER